MLINKVQASQITLKFKNTSSSSPLRYLLRNRPGTKNKKAHTTEAAFMNQLLQTEKFLPICVADNRSEINLIYMRYHHTVSTSMGAIIKNSRTNSHKSLGAN